MAATRGRVIADRSNLSAPPAYTSVFALLETTVRKRVAMFRFGTKNVHHLIVLAITAPAAFPAPPDNATGDPAIRSEALKALAEPIPGVDWDEMTPDITRAIERVFERNGWTQESDQFAMSVACKVARIPPWDIAGRLNSFTGSVAERYGLTKEAEQKFRASLLRESTGFLLRHGPAMVVQAREALQTRAQKIPYSPEQVARWARDADSIFEDIARSVDRLADDLQSTLPDDKKDLFRQDFERYHDRQRVLEEMTTRWARGEWDAAHWGLDADPIQNPQGKSGDAVTGDASVAPPTGKEPLPIPRPPVTVIPSRWIDHDPTTWIALVLDFRDRFRLDAGQMSTAWSVHGEMVERAAAYAESRTEALSKVPAGQRSAHEAYQPIRELFAELQDRLDALPTRAQRDQKQR